MSLATTLLVLCVFEAAASLAGAWRRSAAQSDPTIQLFIERDDHLGWRSMPNRDVALGDGRRFSTDTRGWRRFETSGPRQPLLVLGDSFTEALGVADGRVYFDVLASRLGLPVVALGVNGYGTLQELLVASEMRNEALQPAALLLQMTGNDVINDSWALERRSWINNNLMRRPYLDPSGGVVVRDPRRLFERLTLGRELTRRVLATRMTTIEDLIEAGDPSISLLYDQGLAATGKALDRMARLFPDIPAFAFDVSGGKGRIGADLISLARAAGMRTIDVAGPLREQTRGRVVVQSDGAHWNELGHALAGEILASQLGPALAELSSHTEEPTAR